MMRVPLHSCIIRTSSSLVFLHPSLAMSCARNSSTLAASPSVEDNSSVNAEQGSCAARTLPRRKIVDNNAILKHLGIGTLPRAAASCDNKDSSVSASKNVSAVSTLEQEQAGDSTSKSSITSSDQSDLGRDCSSLSMCPSTSSLSENQCSGTPHTDQLSQEVFQKDDELLHDAGCSDELEKYSLPTRFGKKQSSQSRNAKSKDHSTRNVNDSSNKKLKSNERFKRVEPFDICLSESEAIQANCGENEDLIFLSTSQDAENATGGSEGNLLIEEPLQRVLRRGMVLLKKYISPSEQVSIVQKCRNLGLGPGGFYRPGYKDGAKLRLQMMCLGLDWDPQTRKYQKQRRLDKAEPPNIPHELHQLVNRAMEDSLSRVREEFNIRNAEKILPRMSLDVCIVNFYTETGRLGLHQDRDESPESLSKGLPVVSFSVGDSAEFLYGDSRDVNKAEKLILESGDVLVFGGDSRLVFHGISSIIPDSAPKFLLEETRLRPGRLNLTFRQY